MIFLSIFTFSEIVLMRISLKYSFLVIIACLLLSNISYGQYEFTIDKLVACTPVKSQDKTGTCWSFATASFLESELMKIGIEDIDLSEIYVVRNIYIDKARNYVLRQGKANFSQGSLSHDLIKHIGTHGIIPEKFYTGKRYSDKKHDHSELERGLKGFLDGIIKGKTISDRWQEAFTGILDSYLGKVPEVFEVDGNKHTPKSYASSLGLNNQEYISITSFNHHPFYKEFILEIPDNYSNGSYYNIPLDEMMEIMDFALISGYSIAWDGDVSEKGFDARKGIAVLPADDEDPALFSEVINEMQVDQELRQQGFESYATTDDHLMHVVGIALDQNGNKFYVVKNSWGEVSPYKGYVYMSESYMRMKTISIMVNKSALPLKTSQRLFASK